MTAFNQGDIILIPFPFTDFSTLKQRPAVIISSANFNNSHNDVIAMAITSQIPKVISNEEYLLNKEEIEMANLPKLSLVKVGKIITINKAIIHKKLGNLPSSAIEKIRLILKNIL
ncbi:MAG: type II toxin-antitoxin system PemK/MazF family toxin [Candidatus Omnitrophica bacterium]|nr:type II toxin-antitoxin system PemK/MazF family toxin [Candidatus Omnitrophota bacterium]MBU1367348.1 type II toxin-antitoxin system PemK/MazF family toxin [Candidatus Omnitrophota bacterium]MBU2505107.1 type II toxin-antitoxin system PemK/MazF family toxin [Candidatus Omnitrophota bacterium]